MSPLHDIALVGLGVMGRNLALNIADHGFRVAAYDHAAAAVDRCVAEGGSRIAGFHALPALVAALARPRRLLLMVNAGAPVDVVLEALVPLLAPGDIVVDGGNSHWPDTERRGAELAACGLHFVGAGVSGGEEGARHGPAIMPGGSAEAWTALRPIFEAIAAKVAGMPCVSHIGPGGAGHFVKMVHNGIEYADMQLIGEAYHLLQAAGLSAAEMAAVFRRWNDGPLQSYLVEITALILAEIDPATGRPLVDLIQDRAGQKGTGRWALVSAAEQGVVISAIGAAVDARLLSAQKDERVAASTLLAGPGALIAHASDAWVAAVEQALYASKIVAYAQGLALMRSMSTQQRWQLDLAAIARLWRGGCIIRARFLDRIAEAEAATRSNLMLVPHFRQALQDHQAAWREVVAAAVTAGVPVPAIAASLAYYDASRRARLPANLLQAQRDFFGAHTYERIDRPAGAMFHTHWPPTRG